MRHADGAASRRGPFANDEPSERTSPRPAERCCLLEVCWHLVEIRPGVGDTR